MAAASSKTPDLPVTTHHATVTWNGDKRDLGAHTIRLTEQTLASSSAVYEDEPEGTMDGTRFVRMVLRPRVTFEQDLGQEAVDRIHHRAHELCFIANTVNCPVEVEPR